MPQISMAVVEAIVAGAFLGSLADWLFAGILFHGRYQRHPEAWREGGERGRIIGAQAFALVTSAAFIWLASKTGQTDIRGACMLAVLVWLVGPPAPPRDQSPVHQDRCDGDREPRAGLAD